MTTVYEAEERLSRRPVALKVMRDGIAASPRVHQLFLGEMTILGRIDHPNVVRLLASVELDGRLVMVLELIRGETLRSTLSRLGRLAWPDAVRILQQVLAGLSAAHAQRPPVVHRDLEPENIMIAADGTVPERAIEADLAVRRLRVVLEDVVGTETPASLVFVDREFMPPQVRAFIDRTTAFYRSEADAARRRELRPANRGMRIPHFRMKPPVRYPHEGAMARDRAARFGDRRRGTMPAVRHSRVRGIVAVVVVAAGACSSDSSDQSGGGSTESGSTTAESGVTETGEASGPMDGATADGTSADASSDGSTTGGTGECDASPWATGADGPFAVSLDEEGSPAFAVSRPRVSADGRYVLFTSVQIPSQELSLHWVDNACQTSEVLAPAGFEPGELAAGLDDIELSADGSTVVFNVRGPENGQLRAFAYDVPSHTQERIDVLPDGTPGSGAADAVSVSGDGRYVAFVSNMTMTADDDEDEIFDAIVRDRQTGTNELVSVDDDGAKSNNHVDWTSISSDGQLVGFSAFASSLSPIDDYTTGNHAYVRNRAQGVLELASPQPADLPAGATTGFNPHVSGSGRWVVFGALHGIAPDDDDERDDIYLRDRETQDVIMVSRGITEALGDVTMTDPWVSDDGQRVLYTVGKNDGTGIFVHLTDRTLQKSIEVGPGLPSLQVTHLRMSADGQWLVEIVSYPDPFDPPLMPGTSVVAMRRVDTLFE